MTPGEAVVLGWVLLALLCLLLVRTGMRARAPRRPRTRNDDA